MNSEGDWSRRTFLKTVGTGVPTLTMMLQRSTVAGAEGAETVPSDTPRKFTRVDLSRHFNASPTDFGERSQARMLGGASQEDGIIRVPTGEKLFRGIPFTLGPEGIEKKSWVVLSRLAVPGAAASVEIPLQKEASFLCLAAFCDWDKNEMPRPGEDAVEQVGQSLAEIVLTYEDGSQELLPFRRRFEVYSPQGNTLSFRALPPYKDTHLNLTDSLKSGLDWGFLQTSLHDGSGPPAPDGGPARPFWISALANPQPAKTIKSLLLRSTSDDRVAFCGLTLFHGRENPLRTRRLTLYRLTLPEATAENRAQWKLDVDLGVVGRTYVLPEFKPEEWLASPRKGWGEGESAVSGAHHLYAEVMASPDATLTLLNKKTGDAYEFELGNVAPGEELEARRSGARIEILQTEKVWLQGKVLDSASRQPTPVRISFRSPQERYLPPYGHRTEINIGWFEDYGADVQVLDNSFAYVDGTFLVELPVGEVFVEIVKGFEYEPVRQKLQIQPGQRELALEIGRRLDLRTRGWVTADVHVHFLSPTTAVLSGQAEGLNVVNLLAAQWGDLFTNFSDLGQSPLTSRDKETVVWVGTENRQHLLGHLGLLGSKGAPVLPMSAAGANESYIGDPLWTSMAEWADTCRQRDGVVVGVHFPWPNGEPAADIVMGKLDAVELYPGGSSFSKLCFLDWYRYLNCGYRLAAAGGTDKMWANMPVGANRTYAYIGQEEFTYDAWAKAVRRGNTFSTTGPLLLFQVDGHVPGEEIKLGAGGGTVEVQVEAKSFIPFHRVEVVLNRRVVCSREDDSGTRQMTLNEKVAVPGPGWLAARCASKLGPASSWGLAIQAHTSAVYVTVPGQELFSPAAAYYMLNLIEGSRTWVDELATRPEPERIARILDFLRQAREHLERRLRQHEGKLQTS